MDEQSLLEMRLSFWKLHSVPQLDDTHENFMRRIAGDSQQRRRRRPHHIRSGPGSIKVSSNINFMDLPPPPPPATRLSDSGAASSDDRLQSGSSPQKTTPVAPMEKVWTLKPLLMQRLPHLDESEVEYLIQKGQIDCKSLPDATDIDSWLQALRFHSNVNNGKSCSQGQDATLEALLARRHGIFPRDDDDPLKKLTDDDNKEDVASASGDADLRDLLDKYRMYQTTLVGDSLKSRKQETDFGPVEIPRTDKSD